MTTNEVRYEDYKKALTVLVEQVTASNGRKAKRHPGKFDERLATEDTIKALGKMPSKAMTPLLAVALHRLSVIANTDIEAELADLDVFPEGWDDEVVGDLPEPEASEPEAEEK